MLKQTPISSEALRRSLMSSLRMLRGDERLSLQMMACPAIFQQFCRFQSSLRSTLAWSEQQQRGHQQQLHTTGGVATRATKRSLVHPNLKQRRPLVNGQLVAFHVHDLVRPAPSLASVTAAQAQRQQPWMKQGLRKREYESDMVVVLDMDECLIHSEIVSNPTMAHQLHNLRRNPSTTSNGSTPSFCSSSSQYQEQVDYFRIQLPDSDGGDLVHINVRPGLEKFLDAITSRYETHIFTASVPVYANLILDYFDPHRTKFAARWYREHCTWDAKLNAFVKNLTSLPLPNLARTVLIDNNPASFLTHPSNGILVPSFFDDPRDRTLEVIQQLLIDLEPANDVRPVLEHRFCLKEMLKQNPVAAEVLQRNYSS